MGFIILISSETGFSQASSTAENELINNAEKLFGNSNFKSAMPLYAHLVSVHPENATFNFRYGVCALFAKRDDKKIPVKYLTIAEKKMQGNSDLDFYLGLAYNYSQDYAKALKYYNLYLNSAASDSPRKEEVLKSVNSCLNGLSLSGKKLISEITDKTSFDKDNFHRGYYADDLNGTLIVKPDIFKTKADKKSEEITFVYLSEPQGTCYFSSYGDEENGNKDIYKSSLMENDEWSKPEKISSVVNTQFDEDYPVVTDNGTTLYFCSKGHNSLGGYDIFVSKLDKEKNEWSEPENMGVGVNSPFDDILFIPCKNGDMAYFSSDRDNSDDNITVFNVKLNSDGSTRQLALAEALPQEKTNPATTTETVETDKTDLIAQKSIQEEKPSDTKVAGTKSTAFMQREKLLKERSYARSLTDSAFLFVANTKNEIRRLTNTRERVKRISNYKKQKAESTLSSLDSLMKSIENISDIEIVKSELEKAKSLKREYCVLTAAATEANEMAKDLSSRIIAKENELATLKQFAGRIQLNSVSGDIDSIKTLFTEVKIKMDGTEMPKDISKDIMLISSEKFEYTVPEKELAFADEYLKQKEEGTDHVHTGTFDKVTVSTTIAASAKHPAPAEPAVIKPANTYTLVLANTEPEDEDIEVRFTNDVTPVTPVETINIDALAMNEQLPDDNIEIRFFNDITPVAPVETINIDALAMNEPLPDDDIEVNFNIDTDTSVPVENVIAKHQTIAKNDQKTESYSEINTLKNNNSSNDEYAGLAYFKSSFVLPGEIETSKTDSEILELATGDPAKLSYEELLFAAGLAPSPSKSLEILDFAFVNADRDWRAYNNAAAYAIELKDYNRAKVYLKQALMITDDNGMIENNIGILAYHTGNYEIAEKHFIAAEKLGENSNHNLMVLKYEIERSNRNTGNKVDTTVEPDELIGDIIDYFPANE